MPTGGTAKRACTADFASASKRCKRFFRRSGRYGLASMYPASAWSVLCSGPSWDQRACDLIKRQASTGPFGSPVFACAGKTDLHRRLILSQTSARRLIRSSIAPHLMAVPLFVPGGRSFVPTCACRRAARKGPSRLAVGRALPLASVLPGHALMAPSTARGSRWGGRSIGFVAREGAPLVENRPRDASELVGQRNGEHVVVESLLRRLDPRFEPIAFPMLWPKPDQDDPGRLNEQDAQIAIAAP